jgi:hypothetical protein
MEQQLTNEWRFIKSIQLFYFVNLEAEQQLHSNEVFMSHARAAYF